MAPSQHRTVEAPAFAGKRVIIAETPTLRVMEYTLASGEAQPWHYHSEITDVFYCLEGRIEVDCRDPAHQQTLYPDIPAKRGACRSRQFIASGTRVVVPAVIC
jgi:mannose-6-phosphate isomerase-like protein (cupin superfamily)